MPLTERPGIWGAVQKYFTETVAMQTNPHIGNRKNFVVIILDCDAVLVEMNARCSGNYPRTAF